MSSVKETMYKKRSGTSGICGQLYRTKLTSLILFKLLHDDRFEYFNLACNVDEIGCFDDLYFKAKIKEVDRPILVFIQIKHKDDENSFVDFDETKNFHASYSKVIQKFYASALEKKKSKDIFEGKFTENECIFILYTNAKYNHDSGIEYNSTYATTLNDLIATGKNGTQLDCTDKMLDETSDAILKEEFEALAEHFVKFLNVNQSLEIMLDDYMLRYHAILAINVVNVSEIQSDSEKKDFKWRILTFRENFFVTNDKCLMLLKNAIYKRILQNQTNVKKHKKPVKDSEIMEQLKAFFEKPCALTLSTLLETQVVYKTDNLIRKLQQMNLSKNIIEEAEAIVAKKILLSLQLKVPVTFGNTDLIIFNNKLDHLAVAIENLCKNFKINQNHKIVTLDDTIEDGLLSVNGGLAGTVGNLIVYDENTKLLKFKDNSTSLQHNSRSLLEKLQSKITDLHEYRFDVKATLPFPKLCFDCREAAKDILNKLIIYAEQGDQNRVETILKQEIEEYHKINDLLIPVQPDIIFQNYHSNVQSRWLLNSRGAYFTKDSNIYQDAIDHIITEPHMSSMKIMFYTTKMKNIEYTTESLETLKCLSRKIDEKEQLVSRTVIVTDVTILTVIKVTQYLRIKGFHNHTTLDLQSMINLSTDDFFALKTELKNTDKIILIICEDLQSGNAWYEKYLKEIAQVIKDKQKIIITNSLFVNIVLNSFFPSEKNEINKEIGDDEIIYEKQNLIDMTQETQKNIIKNCNIIFQGKVMSLDLLLDDVSVAFIGGTVLNKIVFDQTIEMGESFSDPKYEEIGDLFQDRTVEYIKSHLLPGNICISNINYISDDTDECPDSSHKEDQLGSSLFSIKFLGDSSNPNVHDAGENNKHPFCIYFYFACRLDPEQKTYSRDAVDFIVVVKGKDNLSVTNRITVNKKDIANKEWIVQIKLLDCGKQFKKWQNDEDMVESTLRALKCMCQRVVLDHIIRYENIQIRNIADDLNKNTCKHLFEELGEEDLNHICSKTDVNDKNTNSDRSTDVEKNYSKILTSDDEEKDYFYKMMLIESFASSFFKIIPNIIVASYKIQNPNEDNFINEEHKFIENNDNALNSLDNDLSESEEVYVYNFQIRFHCKHRIRLNTFDEISDDVAILTAIPGLGKSTLLTHLSHTKKKSDNNAWIVRINLLNYSGEFRKWQQDTNIVIDIFKTLQLIFQVVLMKKNVAVNLKESCNKIYLESCSGDEWDKFNLNMFLHHYNQRKLLFIFDGFDEVCPDYKYEAMSFLYVVKNYPQKNKMWISTRPYNEILPLLREHFGQLFRIEYLNKEEQREYLNRFWNKSNIKQLHEYNVQTLLNFISQVIPELDNKLKIICYAFYKYLVTKFDLHQLSEKEQEIKFYIEKIEDVYRNMDIFNSSSVELEDNEFLGTPLLLHLTADFFLTEVLDIPKVCTRGQSVFNIITMFEKCIQTKLKTILYKNKFQMNINIPFVNETFELELKECMTVHKKLGAHAIFGSPLFERNDLNFLDFKDLSPFNFENETGITEFNVTISRICSGMDRIGLISYVTSKGTPVFIHKYFAEYFALEFISDIMKSNNVEFDIKKLIMTVILSIINSEIVIDEHGNILSTSGLSTWVQEKCKIDEDFKSIGIEIFEKEPLIKKYDGLYSVAKGRILKRAFIRLMNSTTEDYENASFKEDHIEEYLSRKRELDDDLFKMMKPHFRQKFPPFSRYLYYGTGDK